MEAIDRLPAGQRAVIILRDMEGCEAEEACTLLEISAENQRVLLHRARGRIRQTIDAVIGAPGRATDRARRHRRRGGAATSAVDRLAVWFGACRRRCDVNPGHWLLRAVMLS